MKVLLVEPGPAFSVADVARGWSRGLTAAGANLIQFTFGDRLWFFQNALIAKDGEHVQAFDFDLACKMAFEGLGAWILECRPDVVLFVSGFWLNPLAMDLARNAGCTVVLLCTESPYEDVRQLALAAHADIVLLNDPANLERFTWVCTNTRYVPHSYDPSVHRPGPALAGRTSDLVFIGTGYQSRRDFFAQIDWTDIDLALLGNWPSVEQHPLRRHVRQTQLDACIDNDDAIGWYQSANMSINVYRQEAELGADAAGWAMTPREIELAAIGCPFITQPRGENLEHLPFVPKFTTPAEAEELIRWMLTHDDERIDIARKAREALAGWTFEHRARQLLALINRTT